MALIATVGGTDSNSYITRAVADAYHADRPSASDWAGYTDAQKDASLIAATARLDQLAWYGSIVTDEQALAWPRAGCVDREGRSIASDSIPSAIQYACAELALDYAAEGGAATGALDAYSSVSVGPISIALREGTTVATAEDLASDIRRLVKPLAARLGSETVRLVRG